MAAQACACCYAPFSRKRDGHAAAEWWKLPNETSAVPEDLRGIFWLDGNWDSSLLQFSTSQYDSKRRRIYFQMYAVDGWASTQTLDASACLCASYAVYLDSALRVGSIHFSFDWCCYKLLCYPCNFAESCSCLVDMKMTQSENDPHLWKRDSVMCRPCCGERMRETYDFKRVVDATGAPTPHYADMIKAPATAKLHTRTPTPWYCGRDKSWYDRQQKPAQVSPTPAAMDREAQA